jgi:hypothetical protein
MTEPENQDVDKALVLQNGSAAPIFPKGVFRQTPPGIGGIC